MGGERERSSGGHVDRLVRRIQERPGDGRAKDRLYRMTRERLLPRLRSKIPQRLRSRLDAEDVLDDAFLRALSGIDRFRPTARDSFLAWVYRIGKNLIIDSGRRWSAGAVHFAAPGEGGGPRASSIPGRRRTSVESQLERKDLIDAVLGGLPEKEAEVIRLRALKGASFEEIASTLEKTPGAVQRFFSRAMARLNEIVHRRSGG